MCMILTNYSTPFEKERKTFKKNIKFYNPYDFDYVEIFGPPYYYLRILGPAIAKHILFNLGLVLFKNRKLLVTNIISINFKALCNHLKSFFDISYLENKVSGSKEKKIVWQTCQVSNQRSHFLLHNKYSKVQSKAI